MPNYDISPDGRAVATGPMWKTSKEEARAERDGKKQAVKDKEDRNKTRARKRDGSMCRFPRCACLAKRLHPEVAHIEPKGMGGDHGERSDLWNLICLCKLRHQDSRISIHAGTLRLEALSVNGTSGPVRWWANVAVLDNPHATPDQADWQCVAEETRLRVLKPPTHQQGEWLRRIQELSQ